MLANEAIDPLPAPFRVRGLHRPFQLAVAGDGFGAEVGDHDSRAALTAFITCMCSPLPWQGPLQWWSWR